MTRTEALAIVTREAPCPHESWEGGGTKDWAKCADCRATFRKDGRAQRKAAAEEFQRALDLLAAEPDPKLVPTPPHTCITIPKRQPDESFAGYQLRVLQTYFPEAQVSKVTGRATVDTGEGWLTLRHKDADVFAFEATFVSNNATAGEGSVSGWSRTYTDPGRALAEVLRLVQEDEQERVKALEFTARRAGRKADICGALRKRLEKNP